MQRHALIVLLVLCGCPGDPTHPPTPLPPAETGSSESDDTSTGDGDGDSCGGADECAEGGDWGSTTGD